MVEPRLGGLASGRTTAHPLIAPLLDATVPQICWTLRPRQVPVREGISDVGGARLWYWDTGGDGEPIVLLHAAAGSGASWIHQQPVLAAAGYRVIAYSRRGFYRSEAVAETPQANAADLHGLADHLGLARFHLVGVATGGEVAAEYVVSHPERLFSFTLANSMVRVAEAAQPPVLRVVPPEGIADAPAATRKLGTLYRTGNPKGTAAWTLLERQAKIVHSVPQRPAESVTWRALSSSQVPGAMLTGDADMLVPPAKLIEFGGRMPEVELSLIGGAGHAAHWEQPKAFNKTVLDFIRRHPRTG